MKPHTGPVVVARVAELPAAPLARGNTQRTDPQVAVIVVPADGTRAGEVAVVVEVAADCRLTKIGRGLDLTLPFIIFSIMGFTMTCPDTGFVIKIIDHIGIKNDVCRWERIRVVMTKCIGTETLMTSLATDIGDIIMQFMFPGNWRSAMT